MKHQWLAYLTVGLLAIGAGAAIAGLPDDTPVDITIVAPATTVAPEPTVTPTTVPPAPTTTAGTTPATTTTATAPQTTDSMPAGLPDRSELQVVAANGANVAGVALQAATQLEALGYVDVVELNGSEIVELTTVYFSEGFDEAALRLAADLELPASSVAPIQDSPGVDGLDADVELLAYIGRDRT